MRRRATALFLALALLSTTGLGCIGHFGLSQKVRKFNLETTEDRWGREILFVVLYVIPVYPFAGFLDILIFNSVEFWTGENPISKQPSVTPISYREVESEDGSRMLMTLREDRSIDVELEDAAGNRHFVNLIQTPDGVVARDEAGKVLASAADLGVTTAQPHLRL
jgi:hypothetical protein